MDQPTVTEAASPFIEAAIDELNLETIEIEIDYDAPEPGSSFPPRFKPGVYDFKFELEDDPFGKTSWKKEGQDFFEVRHKAIITKTNEDGSQEDVTLRFIRANAYTTEGMRKMKINNSLAELLRSLQIYLERPVTGLMVEDALRAADGRAFGRMIIGWRVQFPTGTVFSTNPRKKKGEIAWPKEADKTWSLRVTDPSSGATAYGRENVINYMMPLKQNRHQDEDNQFS